MFDTGPLNVSLWNTEKDHITNTDVFLSHFCFCITVWHLVLVYGDPACDPPIYSSPCGCQWHWGPAWAPGVNRPGPVSEPLIDGSPGSCGSLNTRCIWGHPGLDWPTLDLKKNKKQYQHLEWLHWFYGLYPQQGINLRSERIKQCKLQLVNDNITFTCLPMTQCFILRKLWHNFQNSFYQFGKIKTL